MKVTVTEENLLIIFDIECEGDSYPALILTPKEGFEWIRKLQRALFEWHELTGRKIDEPECY